MKFIGWREEGERLDTQLISYFSDWRWDMICLWIPLWKGAWRCYIRRKSLTYRYQVYGPAIDIEAGYISNEELNYVKG